MNSGDSVIGSELRSRIREFSETGDGTYETTLLFDPAFRGFEGHFPDRPIVPGVCLAELARVFAEVVLKRKLRCVGIRQCRFRRPVEAGDEVRCRLRRTGCEGNTSEWSADISVVEGGTACQMRMLLEES